jgi:hypothetical protein
LDKFIQRRKLDPELVKKMEEKWEKDWSLFVKFNEKLGFPIDGNVPNFYFTKEDENGIPASHNFTDFSIVQSVPEEIKQSKTRFFKINPYYLEELSDPFLDKRGQKGLIHEFFHGMDAENESYSLGFNRGQYSIENNSYTVFDEAVKEFLSGLVRYGSNFYTNKQGLRVPSDMFNDDPETWEKAYLSLFYDPDYPFRDDLKKLIKGVKEVGIAKLLLFEYFRTLNKQQKITFIQAIIKDGRTGSMDNLLAFFELRKGQEQQIIDLSIIKQKLRQTPPVNYYGAIWQAKNPGFKDPLAEVYAGINRIDMQKAFEQNVSNLSNQIPHSTTPKTQEVSKNQPLKTKFEMALEQEINSPINYIAGYKLQVYHNGEPNQTAVEILKNSSELAIGDMHGSLLKFLDTLILGGFIEVKDTSKLEDLRTFCHLYSTLRSILASLLHNSSQIKYVSQVIQDRIIKSIKYALHNKLLHFSDETQKNLFNNLIDEVESETNQNIEYLIQRNHDGSIKSGKTDYDPLFKLLQEFFTLSSPVFEQFVDKAMGEIEIDPKNKEKVITILGDEICDRSIGDDGAMMKIIKNLRQKGLKIKIIASNHLIHGLFLAQNDLSMIYKKSDDSGRSQSATGLQAVFRLGSEKYKEMLLEYIEEVDMFRYDSVNKVFYTHAPITPKQIQELLDILKQERKLNRNINYEDIGEGKKLSILDFTELTNQYFKEVCKSYLQGKSTENYQNLNDLYNIVSTRSDYQDTQTIPFFGQDVKIVHGHDSSSKKSSQSGLDVFNLDNESQKGASQSEYNTHLESSYFVIFNQNTNH